MVTEDQIKEFLEKNKLLELPEFSYEVIHHKPVVLQGIFNGTTYYNSGATISMTYKVGTMTIHRSHHISELK